MRLLMRKTSQELQEIMRQHNVSRIWSWSKWNCFHNSPYEYYLKYIKHIQEDRATSIYTTTGGIAHSILEKFYTKELVYDKMLEDFEDGWITAFDIAGLKFDRNNDEHNDKIAEKYHDCLAHFFVNHTVIPYKTAIEQFMLADIGGNLFQGYIDCCFKDNEDNYNIVDFKTSSIYKGKKAEEECGQLVVYAIGLHQHGVPMDKIKICWNFLKYVTIQYEQANGVVKERTVERSKIGESLQANAKTCLKKLGYVDQMDCYLKLLLDTNNIECLPDDVRSMYKLSDCYVYVPLTDKLIDRWQTDIINQIKDIEMREQDYKTLKENGADEEKCSKAFWDTDESIQAKSYYFSTLCSYSPNLHLPYKAYLDRLERQKSGVDMFGGINGDNFIEINKNETNLDDNVDLSWLNGV